MSRRLDILRLPAPQLRNRWGPAAIFANDLLLLDEGDRRRRRRHLGHHRTAQDRAWRPYAGFGSGAKDAALLRCNCRGDWSDGCRCEFLLAHTNQIIVNGLRRNEGLVRNSGYRVGRSLVLIPHIRDVHRLVHVNVVVDVGDLRSVDDGSVRNVDVGDVGLAHAVRRAIDVARSQGEPRHACGWRTANGHADSPMCAADPRDERRRIPRAHKSNGTHRRSRRARHPAPHAADSHPTAIVERSKAPRFVVNPSPAPRRDPHPMAVTIGRSEEHTSELQSRLHLVCRLLLEKKKRNTTHTLLSKLSRFPILISPIHPYFHTLIPFTNNLKRPTYTYLDVYLRIRS